MSEDDCPVCLEALTGGTVVTLGCCKNRVHVQCYVTRCPFCRKELPVPTHVAVPVPVPVQVHVTTPRRKTNVTASVLLALFAGTFLGSFFLSRNNSQ
jgi:hypothetical protein